MLQWRLDWTWGTVREQSWVSVVWQVTSGLDGATPVRRVTLDVHPRTIDPMVHAVSAEGQAAPYGRLYRVDGDDDRTVLVAAGRWLDMRVQRGVVNLTLSDEAPGYLGGTHQLGDDTRPWPGPMSLRRTETYQGGAELFFGERPSDGQIVAASAYVIDAGRRWPETVFTVSYLKMSSVWGPIVYGAPGSATQPGSPAYLIDEATVVDDGVTCWRILIARHRVEATTVHLWARPLSGGSANGGGVTLSGHGEDGAGLYTVYHAEDDDGVLYAYVRIPSPDLDPVTNPTLEGAIPAQEDEMRVSWTGGDGLPGGAGSVLLLLLSQSALRVDLAAWQAVVPDLDRYVLAGYIDSQVAPADYAARIMSALPVSMSHTATGVAPALHPWAWDRADGEVWHAPDTSGEVTIPDRTTLSVSVAYAYLPRATDPGAVERRTPANSAILTAAESYGYGLGEAVQLDCPFIWSQATAALVADSYVRTRIPGPRISYEIDSTRHGPGAEREFTPGQCLRLTDAALEITGRLAVVVGVEVSGNMMRIDVELAPDLTGQR